MSGLNIGDLIATSIVLILIVLFFVSLFLFVRSIVKRGSNPENSSKYLEESLQNIQKQNEEIIQLLKKNN